MAYLVGVQQTEAVYTVMETVQVSRHSVMQIVQVILYSDGDCTSESLQ